MAIRNDYLQDMIARFVEAVLRGIGRLKDGAIEEGVAAYEQVVGDVLDMDSQTALALSPASLVTMMQISAVDDRLAAYAAYCLGRIADACEGRPGGLAGVRREQARAIEAAYGIEPGTVPPEVQAALDAHEGAGA